MSALGDLLGSLAAVFPHPPPTPERARAYAVLLRDLTDAECAAAFHRLGNDPTRRFYPAPGEIREAARPTPAAPSVADVAALFDDLEWDVCYKRLTLPAIGEKYGEAARRALVAAGGMEELRRGGDARIWCLKRFTESYQELQGRELNVLGPVNPRVLRLTQGIGGGMTAPQEET